MQPAGRHVIRPNPLLTQTPPSQQTVLTEHTDSSPNPCGVQHGWPTTGQSCPPEQSATVQQVLLAMHVPLQSV
jgi:hypothetical protein